MKIMIALLLMLCMSLTGFSKAQADLVLKGNKAYSAGSFSIAAEQYKKVVGEGYESPVLFYNIGNACFKQNDFASAILWYERAKRLDPGNEDINFNLNVANTKISDKIEPLPELFYKRWFDAFVQVFSTDAWAILCVVMFFAALLCLVVYVASRVLILRKLGFWCGSGLFAMSLIALFMAWNGYRFSTSGSEAIVFSPTITVKSSPDEKSTDLFVLHEGTKVRLLDTIGDWFEIRIASGSVGWLPKSALEKI
jgi:tetratricopeptide (TPR) repeat protein